MKNSKKKIQLFLKNLRNSENVDEILKKSFSFTTNIVCLTLDWTAKSMITDFDAKIVTWITNKSIRSYSFLAFEPSSNHLLNRFPIYRHFVYYK